MIFLIKCSGCYYLRPLRNMFNVQSSNLGDIGINVNLDHKYVPLFSYLMIDREEVSVNDDFPEEYSF